MATFTFSNFSLQRDRISESGGEVDFPCKVSEGAGRPLSDAKKPKLGNSGLDFF